MKKKVVNIGNGKYNINFIGDVHFPRGKYNLFRNEIQKLAKDQTQYMIGLGDWVESILPKDPRYNPEETVFFIQKYKLDVSDVGTQYAYIEEALQPIAEENRILGLHNGNHEQATNKRISNNELSKICGRLGTEYYGDGAAITILQGKHDKKINILSAHGVGGGLTPGFAINKLEQHSNIFANIDIIAEGHTHRLSMDISENQLDIGGEEIKHKVQWHLSCGSFLGNYDLGYASYAELKMYKPTALGYMRAEIEDGEIRNVKAIVV